MFEYLQPDPKDIGEPVGRLRRLVPFLPILAVLPFISALGVGFLSDDFFAVTYAAEGSNVLHDFGGAQYDLSSPKFYRPLVTFSLWMQHAVFGHDAFAYRMLNVIGHLAGTICVAAIGRRLGLGALAAFFAALLHAWFPFAAGSVIWIVGRVDSLMLPLALGAVWAHLVAYDVRPWHPERAASLGPVRRSSVWVAYVLLALALLTKETAVSVPFLIVWGELLLGRGFRGAWRCRSYFLILAGYLAVRWLALGSLVGGYQSGMGLWHGGAGDWLHRLGGWSSSMWRCIVPWPEGSPQGIWVPLRAIPLLLLTFPAALALERGFRLKRRVIWGLSWALTASLPLTQQWSESAVETNLRTYQLAFAGLAVTIGGVLFPEGGWRHRWPALGAATAIVAGVCWGVIENVRDHREASAMVGELVEEVQGRAERGAPRPLVLEDVPRSHGSAYVLSFGVREAFRRPFCDENYEVVTYRKMFPAGNELPPLPPELIERRDELDPLLAEDFAGGAVRITGADALRWNEWFQQGVPVSRWPPPVPRLTVARAGSRVRFVFLSSLGAASGVYAAPEPAAPGSDLSLTLFELLVLTPITPTGEGALYHVMESLDKGEDRIHVFAQRLDESGGVVGRPSDLLAIEFAADFLPAVWPD